MKPIRTIITALCLAAAVFMASCSYMEPSDNGSLDNNNNDTEIRLFLSGVVKSTSGSTIKGVQVHIQGTDYMSASDDNGIFVIESQRTVTIGNADEKVLLVATDKGGAFTTRIVEVTIGEWANGEKTISNIEIVMDPVSAVK